MPPLPRLGAAARDVASVRTSKAEMSKQEEQVERALAAGSKTMVNGIAFPADVAKRLLRNANVGTNDTFLVSCFVDLALSPPPALSQESKELQQRSPLKSKKSRTARVGFGFGGDPIPEWEPLQPKSRPSSGNPSSGGAVLQPLSQQLHTTPKGPYQVRLPVSCSVADAAVIVQNTLRDIQQRERLAIQAAQDEHNKSMLYGHMLMSCDAIAQQREAAILKSIQRVRGEAAGDSNAGPPAPAAAGRRTSLFGQNKQMPRARRPSATPEMLSLKLGGGSGSTTPSPQQLHLTLRSTGPTDLSSTTFDAKTIAMIKTVTPDDVCGAHSIGIASLGALAVDIPRAGDTIDVLEAQALQEETMRSNSLTFTTFTAFDDPFHQAGASHGRSASKLCGAISGIEYKAAFAERRFTLRPCDALGRVLSHVNPHLTAPSALHAEGGDDPLCFAPPTKPLMQCFPKGTINFAVCLAPDDAFHRERIQALQSEAAAQRHDAQQRISDHRREALEAMQATWNANDRQTLVNSYERDQVLRAQLQRPTATESYKAFVKEEATEEYAKRKLRVAREGRAALDDMKRVAQQAFKALLRGVYLLEGDATRDAAELRALEEASWSQLVDAAANEKRTIAKAQRVALAFHKVGALTDNVAMSNLQRDVA